MQTQILQINQQQLCYAESGVPNGVPVFYFHGIPGSRLDQPASEEVLRNLNIRLITIDRPGYGMSEYVAGRKLLDWPETVEQLANTLGIAQFYILGFSAPVAYAAACASRLSARVKAMALVGAIAPLDKPGMMEMLPEATSGMYSQALANPLVLAEQFAQTIVNAEGVLNYFQHFTSDHDRHIFSLPAYREKFLVHVKEGLAQGMLGAATDMSIVAGPWEFELSEVVTPARIWHGEADYLHPVSMSQYLNEELPNSELTILPDTGHFGWVLQIEEILGSLIE